MSDWVTPLEPRPAATSLPPAFPSPFDELGPHALARQAANALQAELRRGRVAPGLATAVLETADGGKMFGVLVVQEKGGRLGYLRGFSGLLAGRWDVPGFVPPVFEQAARHSVEPLGEADVKALSARVDAIALSPELAAARQRVDDTKARHAVELTELTTRHRLNRLRRHEERRTLQDARGMSPDALTAAVHGLDQQSRGDKAERRRLDAAHQEERTAGESRLSEMVRQLEAAERFRSRTSSRLMQRLHDTYVLPNARGEARPMRLLFAPGEPPSGAGDCAAPKLVAFAYAQGLRPLALAEFWWGAPPPAGGRVSGAYYPACRAKCEPILRYMLEGLTVTEPRAFRPADVSPSPLSVVYEDEWLVVVDKPCGLLSVPGRDPSVTDSVLGRLRARFAGPLLVHRLDLDTSGLLLAALDAETHRFLQRRFVRREVQKRYVAWVEGRIEGDRGTIDLPLRVDLNDRPRQIYDREHGKPSLTEWEVLERTPHRTRIAFHPLTGRTHQLRVHAAHPLGLGAPIVGDRLYGHAGGRLMLHAERLSFTHPRTGQPVVVERAAPF